MKGTFTRTFLKIFEDRRTILVTENELVQGEKEEKIVLQNKKRLDLVDDICIIGLQSLCQVKVELIPGDKLLR